MSSRLPGFHRLSIVERRRLLVGDAGLSAQELAALDSGGLSLELADRLSENVVGLWGLPLSIGANLRVNGRDVLAPMAVEEPSVVAGMSHGALLARAGGGFFCQADPALMRGQLQVLDVPDIDGACEALAAGRDALTAAADELHPTLGTLGGGTRAWAWRTVASRVGQMLIVEATMDVRDAMGANAVNTSMEAVAPLVERLTGGRVVARILSNLADERLARAQCEVPVQALTTAALPGEAVARRIVQVCAFAEVDAHRAATHNKGIMNGIDAVAVATGNDWRAIEAGAHAYACRNGAYAPLSTWACDGDLLVGKLELPLAVGTVGGATRVHPLAQFSLRLMGIAHAAELAEVMAAVGLAQNLAALRALATEGIQRGHMRLHARRGEATPDPDAQR